MDTDGGPPTPFPMPWQPSVTHAPLDPGALRETHPSQARTPAFRTVFRLLAWTAMSLLILIESSRAADSAAPPPPPSPPPPPARVLAQVVPDPASTSASAQSASTNRHLLDFDTIVRLVHQNNPTVRAAREEMQAAQHGLEEFRANLSRLEPYVELRSDESGYPNRRDALGNSVESVLGVRKETFEGAIFSAEVGGAYSQFAYDTAVAGLPSEEAGGGALIRARVEMPFFGSRRRQDRIISQAFQESTARRAQLDYLKSHNLVVDNALDYFNEAVYYERLIQIYRRYSQDLTALAEERRLRPEDKDRVESVKGSAETTLNIYQTRRLEDQLILRAYLAIQADVEIEVRVPEYRLSPFAEEVARTGTTERLRKQARDNNPTFTVLEDAKRNANLKRDRAIRGRYDVTAFVEGTTFPIGSPSYDNRYEGWTVGGGVNVRLNDRRVLDATRHKAEAEVRQFEAQIEAEDLLVRRQITIETQGLLENDRNRRQILEVVDRKTEEFKDRLQDYFESHINIDQLIDTRSGLTSSETSLAANLFNSSDRESRLLLATGRAYELVGLQVRQTRPAAETPDRSPK